MDLVRRLARVRIVQFAAIGGVLFAASARFKGNDRTIVFSRAELASLHAAEASRKVSADPKKLASEVDERAIEDEILYREGLKRGFDRDDAIIRQRVIQRTLFFAEEMAGATEPPTEAELRAYHARTQERWTRPERFDFTNALARTEDDAAGLAGHPERGAPSPVPAVASMTRAQVVALLGEPFADALAKLAPGETATLRSPLGFHLVTVTRHELARPASFDEARPTLRLAFTIDRRKDAVAAMLGKAFRDYDVRIDGDRVATLTPDRIAVRRTGSAED